MSALVEAEKPEELDFKWGKLRSVGGKKKDVRFYETFTYDGMYYALNDCVFMYTEDEAEPYIGKLVKIWENSDRSKKVKVQWFFRPWEISVFLGEAEVKENELFFASGAGIGLTNINPLEAIAGKCNVVCISKDNRNLQPSAEEVQMADYIFYRTFDVNSNTISDQMGDTVGGLDVKYVFNRTESLRDLDVRNLNPTRKDVIACGETPEAAGKNPLLPLKIVKLDVNEDLMLGKKGTNANEVQAKHGGLLVEGSSGGNMTSSKIGKTKGITLEKKNMPADKNGIEKDKFEDIKSPDSQVKVEEGVKKSARDFGIDLDYTRSKKAKLDGRVSTLEVNGEKSAQSLTNPGKAESELDKIFDGSGKDVNVAGKSNFVDENLSNRSVQSAKKPTSGRDEDLNALLGKQSKANIFLSREKLESAHAQKSVGAEKGKKRGENSSARMERSSKINVILPGEVERPVTPNGTLKARFNEDFQEYGQAAKLVNNLNASTGRSLKRSADLSKEKSNIQKLADYEIKDKLADDSSPFEGPPTKKGKLDDFINKVSGKTCSDVVNKSPRLAANDSTTKSKHGKGALNGLLEGGPSKKGNFEDTYRNNNVIENVIERTYSGEIKNSLKVATHENVTKLKLVKGASKETFDNMVGKPSKNNLPSPPIVTCNGVDGKVGSRVFTVTRRPIVEKTNWMKLPWENKMKTAHDQGRLVLLLNLDPEYTSGEVEDIVWHAFKEESTAKMVQQTATSNPYSGQAFVIFKSSEAVDRVVKKLEAGCLMLPNKRPLVARIIDFPKFLEKKTFVGHLAIDKARRQRETKEALSTSHYSQNNTVEYEMAMAWWQLQSKSYSGRKKLYEQQRKEIKKLTDNLKLK